MNDNKTVTATFTLTKNVLNFTTMQRHDLIQAILDTAGDAHLIKAQAFDSGEDVIYDNPNTIVLEGGYDCTMENIMPGGMTKIRSLVITKGTLILKHIEIGGA